MPQLRRGHDHLIEKIANDLVTIGSDADSLSFLRKSADHPRTCEGFAGARRTLHRKDALVQIEGYAHRRSQHGLTGLLPDLSIDTRRGPNEEIASRAMISL